MLFCISAQKKSPSAPNSSQILPQLFLKALPYRNPTKAHGENLQCERDLKTPEVESPFSAEAIPFLSIPGSRTRSATGLTQRAWENSDSWAHPAPELLTQEGWGGA